ncbi:DegV family protein [Paenibacillus thermoaerophilus]|uniref:DegV family protein n=1 Tax=Paenibacillus thermoaerophilus TaxID=1215385 RepID=A0ABW2V1R1_9BACL|nr:DegV family protein [Paenibacillus thermoaerophilus]TMV19161.1 DegV family protein [Paenibacillus thermoaerophilus]
MAQVRIVVDSTADIPADIRERYRIGMVPLKVNFGQESYEDSVTIYPDMFYEKLAAAPELPTTSQPSPAEFVREYERIREETPGAQIVSIHLAAVLSGTYQSAVMAKSLMEEPGVIETIDSCSASYGIGVLAVEAAKAAEAGASLEEVVELVKRLRENQRIYFLVDTLEYLHKGGRIGKASALIGSLLNIKPILTLDENGTVSTVDKARSYKKAVARVLELAEQEITRHGGSDRMKLFVGHGAAPEQAAEMEAMLKERFPSAQFNATVKIGPVIGTYTGPGTIAVFLEKM